MLTKLPRAGYAEVEKVATQIANALRANMRWHENFTPMTKCPQVGTNIGTWICYGLSQPKVVGTIGDVQVTKAIPHSLNMIAVSQIPTSIQKTLLIEAITIRVAKLLGAPEDAVVERKDPTTATHLTIELAKLEHGERAEEVDPYKQIAEPFTISMRWPAPAATIAAAGG